MKTDDLILGCVVMAAGSSTRFGENKLLAEFEGRTLIERAFDAVPTEPPLPVCVVTQYDKIEELAGNYSFCCVRNDHPEDGISLTIRLGIEALGDKCDALLFLVSDQPRLTRDSVAALLDFYRAHPDHIVAASHGGKRGNPCIFPKRFFPELCALTGDVGGSAVIKNHLEDLLLFEVGSEELADADTRQELTKLTEH